MLHHSDYVTALAAAPDVAALASAGLRGEAFIWDVLTAGQACPLPTSPWLAQMPQPGHLPFSWLAVHSEPTRYASSRKGVLVQWAGSKASGVARCQWGTCPVPLAGADKLYSRWAA